MQKNSLGLVISTFAQLNTLEIVEWYEKQADFLGYKFLDELHEVVDKILSFPEAFGWYNKDKGLRKSRSCIFPIMSTTCLRDLKLE